MDQIAPLLPALTPAPNSNPRPAAAKAEDEAVFIRTMNESAPPVGAADATPKRAGVAGVMPTRRQAPPDLPPAPLEAAPGLAAPATLRAAPAGKGMPAPIDDHAPERPASARLVAQTEPANAEPAVAATAADAESAKAARSVAPASEHGADRPAPVDRAEGKQAGAKAASTPAPAEAVVAPLHETAARAARESSGFEIAPDSVGEAAPERAPREFHSPAPAAQAFTAPRSEKAAPAFMRAEAATAPTVSPPPAASSEPQDVQSPPTAQSSSLRAVPHGAPAAAAPERAPFVLAAVSHGPNGRLEVRLDPPELGRVLVEFVERDGQIVSAVVSAEKPDTLDLMRRHAETLLRDLGRDQASVDLEFRDFTHGEEQRRADIAPPEPARAEQAAPVGFRPATLYAAAGVDIRV